jgi:hypothetical protein
LDVTIVCVWGGGAWFRKQSLAPASRPREKSVLEWGSVCVSAFACFCLLVCFACLFVSCLLLFALLAFVYLFAIVFSLASLFVSHSCFCLICLLRLLASFACFGLL